MENYIFSAQIAGPLLFIVGVSLLLNKHHYDKIIKEMKDNHIIVFFMSLLGLALGISLFLSHNAMNHPAEMIIAIIGLAMAVKSIIFLILPDFIKPLTKSHKKFEKMFPIAGIIYILFGAYLIHIGYAMYI